MTYAEIVKQWNDNADELNQWSDLGEDEKIEFAYSLGKDEGVRWQKRFNGRVIP